MKNKNVRRFGVLRRLRPLCGLTAGFALMAGGFQSLASAQEEATAITEVYTILLEAVGKSAADEGIGWAMSAIGVAGEDSGELGEISAKLQEIDADLKNINNTLTEIFDAIEAQTCTQTQIASSLEDAVNDITQLYDEYQTYVTNAARTPPVPPSQVQVLQWQNDVLDHVSEDLNAIHNAVYATVNANVIDACAKATAAPYLSAVKTAATFFDDRPSYSQLIDIVNYYYAIYVQGTTILTEAYHLQACQFAANNDPNLHCDFTTASTSVSASEVNEICDAPTAIDVQRACLAAKEAVTDPDTGAGLYERVEAWLKAAGAPYATDQLGILSSIGSDTSSWGSSYAYLFPRDLLDFTNHATINGETVSDCASPLTSTHPCGLTVGRYDLTLSSQLSYGGINGHWKAVTADVLLHLFEPYNDGKFGDRSGALADFMYSIGFSPATKSSALIVTTANTGKNGVSGSEAICLMDTSSPRDKAKQPWCDDIKGQVQGTDNLLNNNSFEGTVRYEESAFSQTLASNPEFYQAKYNNENEQGIPLWEKEPGWLTDAQINGNHALFWQYHWPTTNVAEIGCQNGKPYTNPGGLLSRCAGDLQEYVDALLPPPDSDTTALAASGDATLLRNEPNRNTGEDLRLAVGSRGANEFIVHFTDERLGRFFAGGELGPAILRLSLADRGAPRQLEIVPIVGGFVEGKGVGTGATWTCAEDADVGDSAGDCLQQWPASRFVGGVTRKPDQQDLAVGLIGFDVTEDVKAGVTAWLIRSPQRGASGGAYHSREGALAAREPRRAPTLLLERQATNAIARLRASADR